MKCAIREECERILKPKKVVMIQKEPSIGTFGFQIVEPPDSPKEMDLTFAGIHGHIYGDKSDTPEGAWETAMQRAKTDFNEIKDYFDEMASGEDIVLFWRVLPELNEHTPFDTLKTEYLVRACYAAGVRTDKENAKRINDDIEANMCYAYDLRRRKE